MDCFPAVLEGALKLTEISCIYAEGYPAAERTHGSIARIDDSMHVVPSHAGIAAMTKMSALWWRSKPVME
jgi:glucosamine 6-phosphate synthetase-like amidotransferase/phosphosugar isomerase protein